MKRYLVFAGQDYYPAGGWDDLKLATDDYDEATTKAAALAEAKQMSWAEVIDLETGKECMSFHREY